MRSSLPAVAVAVLFGAAVPVARAQAQIGGLIRSAVNSAAQTKIDNMVDCAVNDQGCIDKAHAAGKQVTVVDKHGKPLKDQSAANANTPATAGHDSAATDSTGLENADATAFVNYDFVPGDSVIFTEDFATDPLGDLPTRVTVLGGNWEVAKFKGQNFLRGTGGSEFEIPLPAVLPAKFTFEMDIIQSGGWGTNVYFEPDTGSSRDGHQPVQFGGTSGIGSFTSSASSDVANTLYHARIMADGDHVKVYVNGQRLANVPEAKLGRSNGIWIDGTSDESSPTYFSNIRVAVSTVSIFAGLTANGRVATHGILFDVNSSKIEAESAPTLADIGTMLQQHPELKLSIEGHTDNTGSAAGNQTLSEARAAAVRQYLIANYKIDPSRLTSAGFGATKPIDTNATAEGRQNNRRVELVKQ